MSWWLANAQEPRPGAQQQSRQHQGARKDADVRRARGFRDVALKYTSRPFSHRGPEQRPLALGLRAVRWRCPRRLAYDLDFCRSAWRVHITARAAVCCVSQPRVPALTVCCPPRCPAVAVFWHRTRRARCRRYSEIPDRYSSLALLAPQVERGRPDARFGHRAGVSGRAGPATHVVAGVMPSLLLRVAPIRRPAAALHASSATCKSGEDVPFRVGYSSPRRQLSVVASPAVRLHSLPPPSLPAQCTPTVRQRANRASSTAHRQAALRRYLNGEAARPSDRLGGVV
ncbi:hypothetical protein PSPO01_00133 [Paraphaeosphaeria sporulosa]